MRLLLAVLTPLLFCCNSIPVDAAGAPAADSLETAIDDWLKPMLDAGHLSGTLLVAKGETVLYEKSFGMADYELGVPNRPDTRFCIASVTKPMTIALVCRLVDEGLMRPDDTVSKWIPDFPRADSITVSHLLNHRAGIPHRVTTEEEELDRRRRPTWWNGSGGQSLCSRREKNLCTAPRVTAFWPGSLNWRPENRTNGSSMRRSSNPQG
jgi:CubicO group peptidase (beta-lactamase class C family)